MCGIATRTGAALARSRSPAFRDSGKLAKSRGRGKARAHDRQSGSMRACAHRRCMKRRLAHAARLFFLSRLSADEPCAAVRRGEVIRRPSLAPRLAAIVAESSGRPRLEQLRPCVRLPNHAPRCCGGERSSTAVDVEQALMLDRRLAPMPTRTLFVSRLRSRSVDGVWRALLAGSFTLFKDWRRGYPATGAPPAVGRSSSARSYGD